MRCWICGAVNLCVASRTDSCVTADPLQTCWGCVLHIADPIATRKLGNHINTSSALSFVTFTISVMQLALLMQNVNI